jgi:phosphoribosyl 1,2-cyclic phosphodiesterase
MFPPMSIDPHPPDFRLQLTFLGVRGSRPTPVAKNLEFGGNTSCLQIRSRRNNRLLIDAGSGLSNADVPDGADRFDLLITHFHSDHIHGLPFFAPLFKSGRHLTIRSGQAPEAARELLEAQISRPYFPAEEFVLATREYIQIDHRPFTLDDITVRPFPLNHPQGAWGYRLESDGATIVHASDVEHGHPELDSVLRQHARGADILIYDAQYTEAEYRVKRGWGHSTWMEATRIAREAGVTQLILFHHDPAHDDDTMREIVSEARQHFQNTDAAREGCTLTV